MNKLCIITCILAVSGLTTIFAQEPTNNQDQCICTMQYAPVCGKDGITYGNACGMACAGVELAYQGECSTVYDERIPFTCMSWYDGCNTCVVVDGSIESCTELACIRQDVPRCLEYTFMYLTKKHEFIIQVVLKDYFKDMSEEEKNAKTIVLRERISAKRASIQDILSRSTFIVGSPALKTYTLQLEVLDFLGTIIR